MAEPSNADRKRFQKSKNRKIRSISETGEKSVTVVVFVFMWLKFRPINIPRLLVWFVVFNIRESR